MEIFDPNIMTRGWYAGNFEPCAYKTDAFEVGVMHHKAGEYCAPHYHKEVDEINYLLEGSMIVNDVLIAAPIIFIIRRNEIVNPEFITDCKIVVTKTSSVPGDKYIVNK